MRKKKTLMGLMILFYLMAIPSVYVHWICDEEYSRPPEGINRPSYTMHRSIVIADNIELEDVMLPPPPVISVPTIERPRPAGEQSAAITAARHTRPPNGAMTDGKI